MILNGPLRKKERSTINNLNLHYKKVEKEKQVKPKVNINKYYKSEINDIEINNKKNETKIIFCKIQ